jgi:hypothetical protein
MITPKIMLLRSFLLIVGCLFFIAQPVNCQIKDTLNNNYNLLPADTLQKKIGHPNLISGLKGKDIKRIQLKDIEHKESVSLDEIIKILETEHFFNDPKVFFNGQSSVISDTSLVKDTIGAIENNNFLCLPQTIIVIRELDNWEQIKEPSWFGIGFFTGLNRQYYNRDFMTYFRALTTYVIDIDVLVKPFQLTFSGSWGGGRVYDSLFYNNWYWQPMTKVSTSNYSLSIGYPIMERKLIMIIPFAGIQSMYVKFKPQDFWNTPEGVGVHLKSNQSWLLGLSLEIKDYYFSGNGKVYYGAGARISYAYSVVDFPDLTCSFHQVKILAGINLRGTRIIKKLPK